MENESKSGGMKDVVVRLAKDMSVAELRNFTTEVEGAAIEANELLAKATRQPRPKKCRKLKGFKFSGNLQLN